MVYRGGVLFACVLLLAVVPAPAGSPDNVPSDAMLVIDVDVSALIKSDLYRLLGEQLDSFQEANEAYVHFWLTVLSPIWSLFILKKCSG